MQRPSILVVLGNRPQFVKHGALARAWQECAPDVRQVIVDTGQHYDHALNGVFVDELGIPAPNHELAIGSGSHAAQLARMLEPLERIMLEEQPASVMLYGDTNSTLGGALVASKLNIPIAHVEAGLRSFDMGMPEEVNRIMCDHVSELLFAPTAAAVANLEREGISGAAVHRSGDVMCDIALATVPAAETRRPALVVELAASGVTVPAAGDYGIVTIHRASNTDGDALAPIIDCLRAAARHVPLIFPIHPRTLAAAERSGMLGALQSTPGLNLISPMGYVDMTALLRGARVAITDSGGLQKEAFVHGIPCITLRDRTEWVETVAAGWNVLAHQDAATVTDSLDHYAATFGSEPWAMPRPDLYGDGRAAEHILQVLAAHACATTAV